MPLQVQLRYIILTMNQHFKIRKNTSLKNIRQLQSTHKLSKDPMFIHSNPNKEQSKKHPVKLVHLEPLKTNDVGHQILKRPQIKFQLTQPVNLKAINFSRNQYRYENVCLAPLQSKGELKQKSLDKQNRPSSMNELKYFNMGRMKLTLENTLKSDSSRVFLCLDKRLQNNLNQQKLNENDKINFKNINKTSQSRTRLRLHQKDLKKNGDENKSENDKKDENKTFRKTLIEQIFHKNKVVVKKRETSDSQNMPKEDFAELSKETYYNSPFVNRETIFDANCSTIKERQENASSFISKKAVEQFIKPIEQWKEETEEKTLIEKKKNGDFDKLKKKFPENFFK